MLVQLPAVVHAARQHSGNNSGGCRRFKTAQLNKTREEERDGGGGGLGQHVSMAMTQPPRNLSGNSPRVNLLKPGGETSSSHPE